MYKVTLWDGSNMVADEMHTPSLAEATRLADWWSHLLGTKLGTDFAENLYGDGAWVWTLQVLINQITEDGEYIVIKEINHSN
jgi:hypothetical protein